MYDYKNETDEQRHIRIYGKTIAESEAERAQEKERRELNSTRRARRWSDLPRIVLCPFSNVYDGTKWRRGCRGVSAIRSGSYECSECGFRWDPKGTAQMDRPKIRKALGLGKLRPDKTGTLDDADAAARAELVPTSISGDDGPGGPLGHLGAGASVEAYRG
jgi:hypothetical protein